MYKVFRNPKIENFAGISVNHDGWKLMFPLKIQCYKKEKWDSILVCHLLYDFGTTC